MKSIKGFSLVELMIVVAIIAILANFSVVQYRTFQSKSRQKEALSLMGAFYAAAKSSESEQGYFSGNFEAVGFKPSGQLHYRILAVDGTNPTRGPNNDTCINTGNSACTAGFAVWTEVTVGAFAAAAANNCTPATNNSAYNVCFSGNIRGEAGADADTWLLRQDKTMTVVNDGIN